jgi:ribose transport system permease protein
MDRQFDEDQNMRNNRKKLEKKVRSKSSIFLGQVISRFSRIIVLIILCIIVGSLNNAFLKIDNLINIFRQTVPIFVLGAGQTLVILSRGIDLSVGSCGALAGVIAAVLMDSGTPILLSVLIGISIGAVFGLINGLIVTRVGLPPFIATFGTFLLGNGLVVLYTGGKVIWGFPNAFRFLGSGRIAQIPFLIFIGLIVLAVFYFILNYTIFGSAIYSVGANPEASKVSGIKINRILTTVYIISGITAAFASLLYISRLNSAKNDIGEGFELDAIAAALIGGTSFSGGAGSIEGTAIGALIIILLRNTMNLLGISPLWQGFATGLLMILLILGDQSIKRAARLA